MEWYEELGFESNPFDNSPGFAARFAVGLEKPLSELEYYVSSGSLVFVEGAVGSGKSVLLRKLAGELGGRAVYADCSLGELNVRSVVKKKTSLLARLLGKSPKNLVLLLDNVANLPANAMELLKYYYDDNNFGSVILAGTGLKSARLSPALVDRIGSRVVKLRQLAEEDAVLMVRKRLGSSGSSNILGDDAVRKLYKMSGKNAAKLLQLCEKACAAAVLSKSSEVNEELLVKMKKELLVTGDSLG
ncbi:ATP-binding protein [Candidatus Woesearchaeota archaeon]|nr:ATP-binding protein [Candidatus Woesearchaeota archaeon]